MSALKHIYIILTFLLSTATLKPSDGLYLGRRHVHIINNLDDHVTLCIHCWSRDDDLGRHVLKPNKEFKWSFYDNYFIPTRFYCNMDYGRGRKRRRAHFVVYDTTKTLRSRPCYKHCKWSVRNIGLYAYDETDNFWDFEVPWPSKNHF